MAKQTVLVSDLSGAVIEDGKGATLRVTYTDARKGSKEMPQMPPPGGGGGGNQRRRAN